MEIRLFLLALLMMIGSASTCPTQYTEFEGNCYALKGTSSTGICTWAICENKCVLDGGHLVSIHSDDENAFVHDLVTAFYIAQNATKPPRTWIGLFLSQASDDIEWKDGSMVDYTNYNDTSIPSSGSCFAMSTLATSNPSGYPGKWFAPDCLSKRPFVCKLPDTMTTI